MRLQSLGVHQLRLLAVRSLGMLIAVTQTVRRRDGREVTMLPYLPSGLLTRKLQRFARRKDGREVATALVNRLVRGLKRSSNQ